MTVSSQMVPEQSSSGNTAIFESIHEHDPLLVADTILKEKDDEIHRSRQELEQQKQIREVETNPTIDSELKISHNDPDTRSTAGTDESREGRIKERS